MKTPPPLRFLGAVLGGWACLRVVMLAPAWMGDVANADQPVPGPAREQIPQFTAEPPAPPVVAAAAAPYTSFEPEPWQTPLAGFVASPAPVTRLAPLPALTAPPLSSAEAPAVFVSPEPAQLGAAEPRPVSRFAGSSRWSASAWAFVRRGEAQSLAAGGMLGGSQIGARLGYRINADPNRPLALSMRLDSPASRPRGAEAAIGLEWKPLARLPVRLLAERRQAIGSEGRSAFSILAHGGVADLKLAGPWRLNAYAQAGLVGIRTRDLFADGFATVGFGLNDEGTVTLGAGLWGAAQPGASRLDVGPSLSLRVPVQGRNARISADWRMRVAGHASPGSGPAVTIGTDF